MELLLEEIPDLDCTVGVLIAVGYGCTVGVYLCKNVELLHSEGGEPSQGEVLVGVIEVVVRSRVSHRVSLGVLIAGEAEGMAVVVVSEGIAAAAVGAGLVGFSQLRVGLGVPALPRRMKLRKD